MFPIISCENFFEDAQKIVNYAQTLEYFPIENNQYTGVRSDTLYNLNPNLDRYVGNRILRNFYHSNDYNNYNNVNWMAELRFHKIKPLHPDQYHPKNCGWIDKDSSSLFGGLIYLDRVPEKDTGTDIYIEKNGYAWTEDEDTQIKQKHYSGEEVLDEDYEKAYNRVQSQYDLSISFKNVFNRMIAYDSQAYHSTRTFGKDQERLTLTFFFRALTGSQPPMSRFG
tara:strand:- start:2194 stop:2865 length:672 start_codon:yes stop_codon:yes gene_type:complete